MMRFFLLPLVLVFADDPAKPVMTPKRTDVLPFEYMDARVPYYPSGKRWGTTAEPIPRMQKPLEPAESIKHFVTPVGFTVQLFASEADLGGKPISMNWDERGRLWVCVTTDYPNEKQPAGRGHDKIVICEDTKGSGRADKFTVFADKLSLPTSLTFSQGGVIVHQPPDTLFLKDTDGDSVADLRRVLFTGWSTADTHAGPSNLHYGLDNWIYGIVGYAGFNGNVGGERLRFSQGFYRFRPDGSKMEFLRNTNNNSWGVGQSEEGIIFGSTANGNPSVYLPIPNRYYEAVRGWSSSVLTGIAGNPAFEPITDKIRQVDYHGHFTSAAGHDLYTARAYPRQYWNRTAFVADPTGHLLATFEIEPSGASFRSKMSWNLLASDDEWSAPIMGAVGPDGQVWAIDWYSFIVQHNPTPAGWKTGKGNAYETELRDKKHGRIYRIVYQGSKNLGINSLEKATPLQLVDALRNDNMFWRLYAQRLLVERGQLDVVPELIKLAADHSVDTIGLNPAAIHALWTLHGLGVLGETDSQALKVADSALHHPSAGVRRNATEVLPRTARSVEKLIAANTLHDTDAQVRLAAFLALADMPSSSMAGSAVVAALRDERNSHDHWLNDAATCAAAAHAEFFLTAALTQPWQTQVPPGLTTLLERVAEHHARGGPRASVPPLVAKLALTATPIAGAIVKGWSRGWPQETRPVLDKTSEKHLVELFGRLDSAEQGQLVELAVKWHSNTLENQARELVNGFLGRIRNDRLNDLERGAAAGQLVDLRRCDSAVVSEILDCLTPRSSPELAVKLLDSITRSEASTSGAALIGRVPGLTPTARQAALRVLLSRSDWTTALLDAAEAGKVSMLDLTIDQRQGLLVHPRRDVAGRAKKLLARDAGIPNPDRQKVVAERLHLAQRRGDANAGKAIFKKNCAVCHVYAGEGGKVGPDLTGMAVHPKSELLVDIFDPSRNVEGNYRQYLLTTRSGRFLAGILSSETKTTVELIDAQAQRHVIQREDIEDLQATPKSLMPEGLEKQLSNEDLANLLEFLTQKSK